MMKALTALTLGAALAAGASQAQAATFVHVGVAPQPVVAPLSPAPVYVSNPYCRPYKQTLSIAGETQVGYGTACLQPDGSWELMTPASGDTFHYIYRGNRVFFTPPHPYASVIYVKGRHHGPHHR
jgi:hypothetical protein